MLNPSIVRICRSFALASSALYGIIPICQWLMDGVGPKDRSSGGRRGVADKIFHIRVSAMHKILLWKFDAPKRSSHKNIMMWEFEPAPEPKANGRLTPRLRAIMPGRLL